MIDEVITPLGTFREVHTKGPLEDRWIMQCRCGVWAYMDDDQWHGRVSVDHTNSVAGICTYHETHDFAAVLGAHIGREP